jgi:hypothetical protein
MRYKNELILVGSIIFMILSYIYKSNTASEVQNLAVNSQQEYAEIVQANNLSHIWSNKKITNKIKVLNTIVPSSKIQWNQKGKKLVAKYHNLNAQELNKIVNKILNLTVQIEVMNITRSDKSYNMELKCKW